MLQKNIMVTLAFESFPNKASVVTTSPLQRGIGDRIFFARPSLMMTRCEKEGLTTACDPAAQDNALRHPSTALLSHFMTVPRIQREAGSGFTTREGGKIVLQRILSTPVPPVRDFPNSHQDLPHAQPPLHHVDLTTTMILPRMVAPGRVLSQRQYPERLFDGTAAVLLALRFVAVRGGKYSSPLQDGVLASLRVQSESEPHSWSETTSMPSSSWSPRSLLAPIRFP